MSSNLPSLDPALVAELRSRLANADKFINRKVKGAINGDQNPITIWHSEMHQILDLPVFARKPKGAPAPNWNMLYEILEAEPAMACTEYPGAIVRAMLVAIGGGE